MRKILATIWCAVFMVAIFSGLTLAEESEFKISDYIPEKFKDLEWKIGGSARLTGETEENTRVMYYPYYITDVNGERDETVWYFNIGNDLNYRYETVQKFLNYQVLTDLRFNRRDTDWSGQEVYSGYPGAGVASFTESNITDYRLDIYPNVEFGRYVREDFFLSGIASGQFMYMEQPTDDQRYRTDELDIISPFVYDGFEDFTSESSSDRRNYYISAEFLPGYGRIYEGNYAATAIYMIDELRKNNALLREPTDEEMRVLSDLVYQNRLKHAVDSRIRRIQTFDEILGYLEEIGVSDASNHYGHLLIQDVWDYFPRDSRQFGWRARAGLGGSYGYGKDQRSSNTYDREFEIMYDMNTPEVIDTLVDSYDNVYRYSGNETDARTFYAKALVEYSRPISQQWQLDFVGYLRYALDGYRKDNRLAVVESESEDGSGASVQSYTYRWHIPDNYTVGFQSNAAYIYNSRTRVDFLAFYIYQRYVSDIVLEVPGSEPTSAGTTDALAKRFELEGSVTYRLSIPTSLTLAAGYNHDSPGSRLRERMLGTFMDDDMTYYTGRSGYGVSVSLSHYLY